MTVFFSKRSLCSNNMCEKESAVPELRLTGCSETYVAVIPLEDASVHSFADRLSGTSTTAGDKIAYQHH